eukprot:CAMPEP_0182908730 /NCGR_PEP_ID=MMETSP0034_2-20130328/35368_1 /TAXON_ID=156128 /ORGANISM="Nephroselmis pyriformis, Strain CCMP717" /LENGTH=377 /DNA_ID=CAMNT_0025044927 /DNA_START=138 /DNA_END=1268 /DNA_ORIENTATION=+
MEGKPRGSSRGAAGVPNGRNVRFGTTVHNSISERVMKHRGWKETDTELEWDFFYADVGWIHENMRYGNEGLRLSEHQRVNHFPNHIELTRKDLMAKNLKRAKKSLEKEGKMAEAARYDFFPLTFTLPSDAAMFVEEYKRSGGVWIMKPIGRAQGKGIFLVNDLQQINKWIRERGKERAENLCYENYVAQRYIANPYLVGGKKFDLRIYALVLSYKPLKVYLYREGFARFTNARFSLESKEDITNPFVHLTNHAVQKKDQDYDSTSTDLKWSIGNMKQFLMSKHGADATNRLFHDIQSLIIHSLIACQHVIISDKHCFEMYGYDVMMDDDLKPWLIETNASPSMSADTPEDRALKFGLLDDVLSIVDVEGRFGGNPPS